MLLIFDLDGTLIDSSRDLAISTNATREHFGLGPLEQPIINSYVGNGAATLVRKAMGPDVPEERVAEALAFFLKYYRAHALEHTRLYAGIGDCVRELASLGHSMAILTNKPQRISFDIIDALGMRDRFVRVIGGDTLPFKKPNPAGILQLIADTTLTPQETLMIGDSSVDVETARNAGVRSCGVTWGFQPETLATAKPDYVVEAPGELLKLVSDFETC